MPPLTLGMKFWKRNYVIHTDYLEFVATKLKVNLAFVQFFSVHID